MNARRKSTPKGQMSGNGSGPAIMMMPPNIREAFMPDPPLKHLPPPKRKRPKAYQEESLKSKPKTGITGVAEFMNQFERSAPPKRIVNMTPHKIKEMKLAEKKTQKEKENEPKIAEYKQMQKDSNGEFMNMNCYNTLFVGRLAYEVTERKLLREFDSYGNVKDIKLVKDQNGKSKGYAFVEFEEEEAMKRAYRAADGMRIEGRHIVVDVERGHTVPSWLPRRLGGGLGGTRLGGKDKIFTRPGRFDPSKVEPMHGGGPGPGMMNQPPPMGEGGYGRDHRDRRDNRGPPPPYMNHGYGDRGGDRYRNGPPPRGGGGGYDRNGPPRGGGGYGGYDNRDRYGGGRGGGYNDRGMKRERSNYNDRDGGYQRRRY
ncbi:U1 small nuclear ribonucleoprotein 70kDa [Chaetoceros tenuissimus]|uniref:U1 small nuclear ribonucleoprotein 70kDa n=1 Tax=Chaetoceros tenuissimus TaxID=426638 RepID=A0AAD3DF30_9STRA|nr:U1 small nuclear ribonucleoprotein 70kDa [Chaetoceros tenuissimus]